MAVLPETTLVSCVLFVFFLCCLALLLCAHRFIGVWQTLLRLLFLVESHEFWEVPMKVINTFQIFETTFHSAALCNRVYLIAFWMNFILEKSTDLPGNLFIFKLFISRVSGIALFTDVHLPSCYHFCTGGAFAVRFCSWVST